MKALVIALRYGRFTLSLALALAVAGAAAWYMMPRDEYPRVAERYGLVIAPFPGADAATVERLVVAPLEEELAEVDDVLHVEATIRADLAILDVQLRDEVAIDVTDEAWRDVEEALARASDELPDGALPPALDRAALDPESMIVAVHGSNDALHLADAAERLRERLVRVPGVSRVRLVGDPDEQVVVALEDASARRVGLDAQTVAAQIAGRARIVPGGAVQLGSRRAALRPRTDLASVHELRRAPILTAAGAALPLGEIAEVTRLPATPATERMLLDGAPAVGLTITPRPGIHVVELAAAVRGEVDRARAELLPLEVSVVSFQPDRVGIVLADLGFSLLLGIVIVAAVLLLTMGVRLGLVVASVVPLVAFASLAVFWLSGGMLQQMSIAALVLALGILVDSAIVVAESIQQKLDAGSSANDATLEAVKELALPLAAATGTTIAAFLPMLLSVGPVGDFTRALPRVTILTLSVSFLFAVLVTPLLARAFLRPRPTVSSRSTSRLSAALGRLAVRHPGRVLLLALVVVGVSGALAPQVPKQFFPFVERDQLLVEFELPEGAALDATLSSARRLERWLRERGDVASVSTFVGRGAPLFFYNLTPRPGAPHRGALLVTATSDEATLRVQEALRRGAGDVVPELVVTPRRLRQGPPVDAAIEVRLYGDDLAELRAAAETVVAEARAIEGTVEVTHDVGLGLPTMRFEVEDAATARRGLSRTVVGAALLGRTHGIVAGQYRAGRDPAPIVVRSGAGERFLADDLGTVDVGAGRGVPVPLAQLARRHLEWQPAAIHHRDGRRMVTVSIHLEDGVPFGRITGPLTSRLEGQEALAGLAWDYGGEVESSAEADQAIASKLPFGMLVLLSILMLEFNSFRRLAIIMVTVPLAAAGVVPGLLAGAQAFGFMSLLGVFALIGIVVNSGIVLIDTIDRRRAGGVGLDDAIVQSIVLRMRPILLTTATTTAGLVPLALSSSSLWPPMAFAMISGLLASTLLTLGVVPALYRVAFSRVPGRNPLSKEALPSAPPAG